MIAALALAGFAAGLMNAIAGGGSFVAFPALVAAGLPGQVANASTTVALIPGGLTSAWAYRRSLMPVGPVSLRTMAAASGAGGIAGALLLLLTPAGAFDRIVPWLLLVATLMLVAGDRPRLAMRRLDLRIGRRGTVAIQGVLGLYGGYFGGAVGLMMLAVWSLMGDATLKEQAPARTIMVTVANASATLCFVAAGTIRWAQTGPMLLGALLGGYAGAQLGRRLPARLVRAGIVLVSTVTTAAFFVRAYR